MSAAVTAMMGPGAHVHPVGDPDADLTVDVIARQGADTAWLVTHDRAGSIRYLAAEDAVLHGRHELHTAASPAEPVDGHTATEPGSGDGLDGTIAGTLPDPPPWPYVARIRPYANGGHLCQP